MIRAAAMPIAVGARIGPYEILGWLGAGGMGDVYRARDVRLARDVAIKVIPEALATDTSRVQRFEQARRRTAQSPEHSCRHDVGIHEGAPPYILTARGCAHRLAGTAARSVAQSPRLRAPDCGGLAARASHRPRRRKPTTFHPSDGRIRSSTSALPAPRRRG
jgi:hypothetical protein